MWCVWVWVSVCVFLRDFLTCGMVMAERLFATFTTSKNQPGFFKDSESGRGGGVNS